MTIRVCQVPRISIVTHNLMKGDVAIAWMLIRLVADNPELWLFHSHMTRCGEAGVAHVEVRYAPELESLGGPKGYA
jgi:hypothetical protein